MSESKGLGDTVEKITTATGIKTVVDAAFKAMNKDCGCGGRKEKLNKIFPYKSKQGQNRVIGPNKKS
jgi:hypothetical protein